MTLQDRADAYAAAYPEFPASHLRVVREKGGDVLYGTWLIGNDYRNKSTYYGAYPAGYLPRVWALFPDVASLSDPFTNVLHAFSGALPAGPYMRCDVRQPAEWNCTVEELPGLCGFPFALVFADPPYSADDAKQYGTRMVNRASAMRALANLTTPGGHVVWLDVAWPQFRKDAWRTVGRITLVRSTNHRVRIISIFERRAE